MPNQLWHNEQLQAQPGVAASWSGWILLPGLTEQPNGVALADHPDGRMHVYAVSGGNQLARIEQTQITVPRPWLTPWTGWSFLGQPGVQVALAAHPDGRMHAVTAANDNPDGDQIYHSEQTVDVESAPWSNWNFLSEPRQFANELVIAAHPDGRMHAVEAASDNQLWHNEQTSSGVAAPWTGWHYLSGLGQKGFLLALAAHPDGRMHAIMAGLDNQVWHNEQAGSGVSAPWTGWHYLSTLGNKAKRLALAAHPDGRMHAVMTGLDDQVWHNEQAGSGVSAPWTGWHYLSNAGNKAVRVALAAHPDGRMHAVMLGLDSQVWHNEQTGSGVSAPWTDWHYLSEQGDVGNELAIAAHPDGRMHVVLIGVPLRPVQRS